MGSNLHGSHDLSARYSYQYGLGTHLDLQNILGWDNPEYQLATKRQQLSLRRSESGRRFKYLLPLPPKPPDRVVLVPTHQRPRLSGRRADMGQRR